MDTLNGRGPVTNIEPHPEGSVVVEPLVGQVPINDFVLWIATAADDIPAWGAAPAARDARLRQFWHTEPVLAGSVFTIVARYAAFGWHLEGSDRMTKIYTDVINSAQFGKGWDAFIIPLTIDYLTQDNGAFVEFVRIDPSDPTSPVITFNHLDSARCIRTGRVKEPVIYIDRFGMRHLMKWWQVADITEMPSPIESMRGYQYCAITRILRSAQIMRDTSIYMREKISGRFNRGIHLVGGIQRQTIDDVLKQQNVQADDMGLTRYKPAAVVAAVDPTAKVSHEFLELASLPDGFDAEKELKNYITNLALAFGTDYQEFAPLPSRSGGGSAGGGDVMHLKGRGKGPKLFMSKIEALFNYHGLLPRNIEFVYGDQDSGEDLDKTKIRLLRAELRAMQIKSGEISPEVARQIAVTDDDLDAKYLAELKDFKTPEQQQLETAKDGMMKSPKTPQVDRGSA